MKNLITKTTAYWLSAEKIDTADEIEMSLYWTFGALNGIALHWNSDFKSEFFDESCHVEFKHDFENITYLELTDTHIKALCFNDSYEGYVIVLTATNGKFVLTSMKLVGEKECDVFGIDEELIENYLK